MRMDTSLSKRLEASLGEKLTEESLRHVTHGGIIQTHSGQTYFLKRGLPGRQYRCEAHGLHELGQTGEIVVADPVAVGEDFVLTRYVIPGKMPSDFFTDLGRSLARVHRHTAATFGFYEDNFIGATPQLNRAEGAEKNDWTVFYFQKRLKYQYRLAERNGYVSSSLRSDFAFLERHLPEWLKGSEEAPCLIHGDLWSGNFLCGPSGEGVLIDPAVYYGHREAELAMTRLFGGFPAAFYRAYMEEYPLPEGWKFRENLYRLYHLLNHLNLFGRGYLPEVEETLHSYRTKTEGF